MRMGFVETMSGTVTDDAGAAWPVSFEVSARAEGQGWYRLEGVARAERWAPEARASGSLHLSSRALRYRVEFDAPSGRLVLEGHKTPSLLAPVASMTRLPVTLTDGAGRVLASGELAFNLRHLPGFLATWLPFVRAPARRVEAEARRLGERGP